MVKRSNINLFRSYIHIISTRSMCFLLLKIPKFRVPFDTILLWKCVCLSTYECLQKYACILITYVHHVIHFLNFLSYHHWRKLNVNQIDTQCFHFIFSLSCTWEGMIISRWRTGQFVQGRSCRLNEILSFTLHYSINWIYTETVRGIIHLMHKRVDPKINRNSHTNHSKWSKQTK